MKLSNKQQEILDEAGFAFKVLSEDEFLQTGRLEIDLSEMADEALVEFLTAANILYREGDPLITDAVYDFQFIEELRSRDPGHPFLQNVEPEGVPEAKTVPLPERMLSTDKAYDFEAIERWGKRIEKAASECGVEFSSLVFRGTPKLDGFAAYDDGEKLYTRGDGRKGTDITRAFDRGLQVAGSGSRGLGPGEIVVSKSYFEEHLSSYFDNSRNFQASLIKEKELEEPAARAIAKGKAVFYPFRELPFWEGDWDALSGRFEDVVADLWDRVDFDIDGVVFEISDEKVKEYMGATRHHHRWQIAFKRNTQTAEVKVLQVVAQTSRSGRVNPVAEIEPTRLSGALIKRATAHHYGMVREKGIGQGAVILLSRSGEVIPKIEEVLESADPEIPEVCPSCGTSLVWESDYLVCVNVMGCAAQNTHTMEHFFKVLGNIDGFGPSSITKIYEGGVQTLPEIYNLGEEDFVSFGFGPKQAENMVAQLLRSREEAIEDWRFLAAFGVHRLGMGNCEKLLGVHPLKDVFSLSREQITEIKGFSEKIAGEVIPGLASVRDKFDALYGLGFNLIETKREGDGERAVDSPLYGKLIVFTGTMREKTRDEMKQQAKEYGAKVGSSITGKTDMLVCGAKVGAAKLTKAEKLGVKILKENEYLQLIGEL